MDYSLVCLIITPHYQFAFCHEFVSFSPLLRFWLDCLFLFLSICLYHPFCIWQKTKLLLIKHPPSTLTMTHLIFPFINASCSLGINNLSSWHFRYPFRGLFLLDLFLACSLSLFLTLVVIFDFCGRRHLENDTNWRRNDTVIEKWAWHRLLYFLLYCFDFAFLSGGRKWTREVTFQMKERQTQ